MHSRNILAAGLLSSLVLFTACGGETPDSVLKKVNGTMLREIRTNLAMVQIPEKFTTTTTIVLRTEPIQSMFDGTIKADVTIQERADVSNESKPVLDIGLTLKAAVDAPAGMLGGGTGKRDTASLVLAASAKNVERVAYLQISKLLVSASALPTSIILPETLSKSWYGATFDEIDAELKKNTPQGTSPVTMDSLLKQVSATAQQKEALETLASNLHIWKGIALLPEKDGNLQVRVESDKETLKRDLDALAAYVQQASGPSWKQMQKDSRIDEQIRKAKEDIDANVGKVKGILSAEKGTYLFRGFDGEVIDERGATIGTMTISLPENGDMLVSFTDTSKQPATTFVFEKKGSAFTFAASGATLAEGTVTPERFTITAYDTEKGTDVVALKADLPLKGCSKESCTVENGVIEIPAKALSFAITRAGYAFTNSFKDMTSGLDVQATLGGKSLGSLRIDGARKEVPSIIVEKPASYTPMSRLQADLTAVVMGALQPGAGAGDFPSQ